MTEQENNNKMKRYVLLGAFIGGLVGATLALFLMPQTMDERMKRLREIQGELLSPIRSKFIEIVNHVGDSLIDALDEASKKAVSVNENNHNNDGL